MKIQALLIALLAPTAAAFAPPASFRPSVAASPSTSNLGLAVDPSSLHDLHHHADTLSNFFTSINLADLDADAIASSAAPAADAAAAAATDVAANPGKGPLGVLTAPIEGLIKLIHGLISSTGVENSWGLSIVAMTLIIKVVTYPLTKGQLESTNKMQVSVSIFWFCILTIWVLAGEYTQIKPFLCLYFKCRRSSRG